MKNVVVLATKQDLNPFTLALKARCEAEGEVLVCLRNGTYCKVKYRPENEAEFESESFYKPDWSACWEPSGHSVTSSDFDIVGCDDLEPLPSEEQATSQAQDSGADLVTLRAQMAAKGWVSEDRVGRRKLGGALEYAVAFKRSDWHKRSTYALIGADASYRGATTNLSKMLEVATAAAALACRAWTEFPDCPPNQSGAEGLEARKPFEDV